MSLEEYSDEDLQQELDDRKQRKQNSPLALAEPDYSNVYASAVEYMTELSKNGYELVEIPIEDGRVNGWIYANIITFPVGTLIGLTIDGATGATIVLEPEEVNAKLLKQ